MSLRSADQPLRLAYAREKHQFGELSLPVGSGPYPVAILIHGGYWRARFALDLMQGLAADLAARGMAVWNIEYRRVGNPGGGWPGTLLDVAQATDFLRDLAAIYPLDLTRVVPIGHSAGGHLAFWLGARSHLPAASDIGQQSHPLKLAGAISLAGVLDLHQAYQFHLSNDAARELLGGSPEEVPARYAAASPAHLLPLAIPQVVIHGTADAHVPLQISQQYAAAARAAGDPITYLEPEGVDHFDVIDAESTIWSSTTRELARLLQST